MLLSLKETVSYAYSLWAWLVLYKGPSTLRVKLLVGLGYFLLSLGLALLIGQAMSWTVSLLIFVSLLSPLWGMLGYELGVSPLGGA